MTKTATTFGVLRNVFFFFLEEDTIYHIFQYFYKKEASFISPGKGALEKMLFCVCLVVGGSRSIGKAG